MAKFLWIPITLAFIPALAKAQVMPEVDPLSLEQIADLNGKRLSKDEVVELVRGAKVQWSEFAGGERHWTNEPSGNFWGTRVGTGVGSFNPHHKAAKGRWEVRDDGSYCVHLDYGHMMEENYCFLFFSADGRIFMNLQPSSAGSKVRISR